MLSEKNRLREKTIHGFFWQYIGIISQLFIQLSVIAILARILNPKDFGLVSLALIFTGFCNLISDGGIGAFIIRSRNLSPIIIQTCFTLSFIISFLMILAMYFISPIIAIYVSDERLINILRFLSLSHIFTSFSSILWASLERELNFKKLSFIKIISYLIGYGIIGIFLAQRGYGVWALVFAYVGHSAVKGITLLLFNRLHTLKFIFDYNAIKEITVFSIGLTYSKIFNFSASNIDKAIVGKYLGTNILGLYNQAMSIVTLPSTYIGMVLQSVLFPVMSRVQDEKKKIKKILLSTLSFNSILLFPLTFFIFINSKYIILFLLGNKWLEAASIMQILSLSLLFRTSSIMLDALIKVFGFVYKKTLKDFTYALSVFLGCIIGLKYGAIGITISVLLSSIINYTFSAFIILKQIDCGWKSFLSCHLPGLQVTLIYFLFNLIFVEVFILNNSFFVSLILYVLVYLLLIIFIPSVFGKYFLETLKTIYIELKIKSTIIEKILNK